MQIRLNLAEQRNGIVVDVSFYICYANTFAFSYIEKKIIPRFSESPISLNFKRHFFPAFLRCWKRVLNHLTSTWSNF